MKQKRFTEEQSIFALLQAESHIRPSAAGNGKSPLHQPKRHHWIHGGV